MPTLHVLISMAPFAVFGRRLFVEFNLQKEGCFLGRATAVTEGSRQTVLSGTISGAFFVLQKWTTYKILTVCENSRRVGYDTTGKTETVKYDDESLQRTINGLG